MAIEVRYFEDTDECYTEGPFVLVNASGYRIESGSKGMKCPTLPDCSIYGFLRDRGLPDCKYNDRDLAVCIVDFLNAKTRDGTLEQNKFGGWVWPPYEIMMKEKAWQEKRARMEAQGIG